MLWCLDTSSPFSPPDSQTQSWQRGSRATATCCPSVGALNRLTLKRRVPEGWKYTLCFQTFSFSLSFPQGSTKKLELADFHYPLPPVTDCLYSIACCLNLRWPTCFSASEETRFFCSVNAHKAVLFKVLLFLWKKKTLGRYCSKGQCQQFVVFLLLYCAN